MAFYDDTSGDLLATSLTIPSVPPTFMVVPVQAGHGIVAEFSSDGADNAKGIVLLYENV